MGAPHRQASLWLAFRSARALGVFDMPSACSAPIAGRYDKLERRLAELQAQYRRQTPQAGAAGPTLLTSRAGVGARPSAQKAAAGVAWAAVCWAGDAEGCHLGLACVCVCVCISPF